MNDNVADPWLIAVAKAYDYTIITFEAGINFNGTPMARAKIPNVCRDLNVKYADLFSMMEQLQVKL